jgi:hypothetical protein
MRTTIDLTEAQRTFQALHAACRTWAEFDTLERLGNRIDLVATCGKCDGLNWEGEKCQTCGGWTRQELEEG